MTSSRDSDTRQVVQSAENCREMSTPIRAWHISQDCRNRIETASKTDPVYRDRVERAEQRKMDFNAKEVERSDHARRALLEAEVVHRPPAEETETEDRSSAREAKRARGEPEQDLLGEIHIPSADTETSSSTSTPIPSGASSRSGVKRTFSESTALPSSSGASSGSGVKRSHDESFMRDDEEQPVTRARLSALIAGLHGVNAAEDDEVFTGDAVTEGWFSSWYPETHMSQKMVIEAKRKEMERFKRMKVYRDVTRESMREMKKEK